MGPSLATNPAKTGKKKKTALDKSSAPSGVTPDLWAKAVAIMPDAVQFINKKYRHINEKMKKTLFPQGVPEELLINRIYDLDLNDRDLNYIITMITEAMDDFYQKQPNEDGPRSSFDQKRSTTKYRIQRTLDLRNTSSNNNLDKNLAEIADRAQRFANELRDIHQDDLISENHADFHVNLENFLQQLDIYVQQNPGQKISDYARRIFPSAVAASQTTLTAAVDGAMRRQQSITQPNSWINREQGETPISFIQRHYGTWREGVWNRGELTRPFLRKADFKLYEALAAWERRHPEDRLDLPTKKEMNDAWVDRVLRGQEAPDSALEKERFAVAAKRRGKGQGNDGKNPT